MRVPASIYGLAVVFAGCSIPNTQFQASTDANTGDGRGSVLSIVTNPPAIDVDEGKTVDFTVALSQAPADNLIVAINTPSTKKLGLSKPTLTFTPTNFATPQTVTATGLVDVDTVTEHAEIALSADGVDTLKVAATIHDLDVVTIVTDLPADSMLQLDEGSNAVVHVHLSAQPTEDVTVNAGLAAGPVTVTPSSRVFTPANYDQDQTFTFAAPVDPNTVNENQAITFSAAQVPDKAGTIIDVDHDVQAISVNPTSLTVTEQGSAGVLNVSLTQMPQANVTITVTTTTGQAAISSNQLTFTPQNYAMNQSINVTGPDDIDTVDGADTIKLHANVAGVSDRTIGVTVKDNDVQTILEDAPQPLAVMENGNATFHATLKFKPQANVVVSVSSLNPAVATASPGTVTFTPTDYDQPHTITVHGTDDNNLATNSTTIRLFEATIGQTDVGVSVQDDDTQKIVLSKNTLTVPEGMIGSFDVSLQFDPGTTVNVSLANTNQTALPIDKTSITFTSANFGTPVTVHVSPPVDSNNVGETATITVSGGGAPAPQTVMASVSDGTTVQTFGNSTPFTGSASVGKGSVIAIPITVDVSTNLDSFGLFVPAGTGDYRMALYRDLNGVPDQLVASMPVKATIVNTMGGVQLGDIVDLPIANDKYWIALRVNQTTAVGQSTITGPFCARSVAIINIDDPWPTPFGAASCQTTGLLNFWINAYHQ